MLKSGCATFAGVLALVFLIPTVQATGKAVELSSARIQECKTAMESIIRDYREGRDFNSRDQRLMNACKPAMAARDAGVVASSAAAGTKGIKPELLQRVLDSANRIVTRLNEHGGDAGYATTDLRMIENFRAAVAAVDCLAAGPSCPQVQAKTIIAQFNERGVDAVFNGSDEQAVRQFHEQKIRKKQKN